MCSSVKRGTWDVSCGHCDSKPTRVRKFAWQCITRNTSTERRYAYLPSVVRNLCRNMGLPLAHLSPQQQFSLLSSRDKPHCAAAATHRSLRGRPVDAARSGRVGYEVTTLSLTTWAHANHRIPAQQHVHDYCSSILTSESRPSMHDHNTPRSLVQIPFHTPTRSPALRLIGCRWQLPPPPPLPPPPLPPPAPGRP